MTRRPLRRVAQRGWIWLVPTLALAQLLLALLVPGGIGRSLVIGLAVAMALFGGVGALQWRRGERAKPPASGDVSPPSETARCLLLGQLAGGMAHELSQSLNVIVMANGNLGYVLDRATLPEEQAGQLRQRVRKIAAHADAASQTLGLFRWFGREGARDGAEMTVGTALERAIAATRATARRAGVTIEIQGDALTHPTPLRHGTIEIMATAALMESLQQIVARPADSAQPEPIVLEATRTQTSIEIAVVTRSTGLAAPIRDAMAEATHQLIAELAASCRSELRTITRADDPVRYRLILDRDMV